MSGRLRPSSQCLPTTWTTIWPIWPELFLQLGLGPALMAAKGYSAQEAEQAFTRAQQLCERLGDPPQLFHALFGLLFVHVLRLNTPMAYELAERLQRLAQ